jgi:hypothetical protein
VCPRVKERGECPHGHARTKQEIGHLSHPRTHPHLKPTLKRNVSPNPQLGPPTLKGGGFGLTSRLQGQVPRDQPLVTLLKMTVAMHAKDA